VLEMMMRNSGRGGGDEELRICKGTKHLAAQGRSAPSLCWRLPRVGLSSLGRVWTEEEGRYKFGRRPIPYACLQVRRYSVCYLGSLACLECQCAP
jgi:hypothetical protein